MILLEKTVEVSRVVQFEEWEKLAKGNIDHNAFTYIQSGAGREETLRSNEEDFRKIKLIPRYLKDVSNVCLKTNILGETLPYPFMLAPVGMQGIAHRDGELGTARAANALKVPFIASTVTTYSLEEIAAELPDTIKWFQLYWSGDWEITASFLRRAENAGYSAIVVTVDTPLLGWREKDLTNGYSPLKVGKGAGNYFSDPVFLQRLKRSPQEDSTAAAEEMIKLVLEPKLTWDDIRFIREYTSLPIIIKGILHPEDAKKALNYGVDGIVVSNHGGRQLDGAISSIEALPAIVEEIQNKIPILFDSGIRSGADAVKALTLGADAVCLGRPFVYGLATAGQEGVSQVLQNFIQDLKVTKSLI